MIKRTDLILIIGTLALALAAFLLFRVNAKAGTEVVVYVNTQETARYPLDQDATHVIEGVSGGTNTLVIKNGTACITDADCPDKLCVNEGTISKKNESIVCLPHKIVITIEGTSDTESGSSNDNIDVIVK